MGGGGHAHTCVHVWCVYTGVCECVYYAVFTVCGPQLAQLKLSSVANKILKIISSKKKSKYVIQNLRLNTRLSSLESLKEQVLSKCNGKASVNDGFGYRISSKSHRVVLTLNALNVIIAVCGKGSSLLLLTLILNNAQCARSPIVHVTIL